MFLLQLSYIAPLDEVDRVRDAHMAWIAEQYEADRFIASGPKVPRTGGVILARAMPRDELDDVIASDPFTLEGVAAYDVMEFSATTVAAGLESLREPSR
ncbi:MAG TPA: YciI family protein [Baekduia sp.]|uniref:YciI family protein n=1 Tax=Baekduia sp. TaxID=2600305 RepID=UPI002D78D44E|nr:YciI family protein [Baekduia sp.]HET6508773.1 YciI family protein [Baekduia sp.]